MAVKEVYETTTQSGLGVLVEDYDIVAVLDKEGASLPLREEGHATGYLIEAVEQVCQEMGWPQESIQHLIEFAACGRNPELRGKILPWSRVISEVVEE